MEMKSQKIAAILADKCRLLAALIHLPRGAWIGRIEEFVRRVARPDVGDRQTIVMMLTELYGEVLFMLGNEHAVEERCRHFLYAAESTHSPAALVHPFIQQLDDLIGQDQHADGDHGLSVRHLIETHYAEPLTIERLARLMRRSPRGVRQECQRVLRMSLREYVTLVRMERAQQLLLAREKVEAVALTVGYKTKRQFIRQFKRHTGMVPSRFRGRTSETASDLPEIGKERLSKRAAQIAGAA
jgi:AraC-like DNA-binding protein